MEAQFTMHIIPFRPDHIPDAANLFAASFRRQREITPALPDTMEHPAHVAELLAGFLRSFQGLVAVEHNRLVGYMSWLYADQFRGADRRGAYCPEWAHAAANENKAGIYRALYRAASTQWAEAGCQVHAITLLAHDQAAREVWFWNGFGLTVVDAVRPVRPLDGPCSTDLCIRAATGDDAELIALLDAEHWRHYTQPPIFMAAQHARDAAANREFLARPKNSVWLAFEGDTLAGFIRFEGYDFDGVQVVESDQTFCITGAYVRPAYRGRRAAGAMLDAALRDYAGRDFTCCAVNFESFNPEAASSWMRHFEPVCLSVLRVPECSPGHILKSDTGAVVRR